MLFFFHMHILQFRVHTHAHYVNYTSMKLEMNIIQAIDLREDELSNVEKFNSYTKREREKEVGKKSMLSLSLALSPSFISVYLK